MKIKQFIKQQIFISCAQKVKHDNFHIHVERTLSALHYKYIHTVYIKIVYLRIHVN